MAFLKKYRVVWPESQDMQAHLLKDGSEVRTDWLPSLWPGASRGDRAMQVREGINPVPCPKGGLPAAVPEAPEEPSLLQTGIGSPGHAAGDRALALSLAHVHMHRAGN